MRPRRPSDDLLDEVRDLMGNAGGEYAARIDSYPAVQLEHELEDIQVRSQELRTLLIDLNQMLNNEVDHDWQGFLGAQRKTADTLMGLEQQVNDALSYMNPERGRMKGALAAFAYIVERTLTPLGAYSDKLTEFGNVHRFSIIHRDRDPPDASLLVDKVPPAYPRAEAPVSNTKQVLYALALVFAVWAIGEVGSS